MRVYRVEFHNGKVFDLHVDEIRLFGGTNPAFRLVAYRVIEGQRDRHPLRRLDGGLLEFTAASDEAACAQACDVLEWVHDTKLDRVSRPSDGVPSQPFPSGDEPA